MLERLKTLASSLTPAQQASLVGAFVAVVALVSGSAYLINRQDYVLLFSDLDAESAADVTDRLKTAKVPYQLADGGRSVRVPQNKADELRLDFASQGLPASGRIGFEIFDKLSFGATEFVEQVNFRRALEGEIARTISTISEVASARVHIAVAAIQTGGHFQHLHKLRRFKIRCAPRQNGGVAGLAQHHGQPSHLQLRAGTHHQIRTTRFGNQTGTRLDAVRILQRVGGGINTGLVARQLLRQRSPFRFTSKYVERSVRGKRK